MLSATNLTDDDLIDRAKKAYYNRARRDRRQGISWNILPESGWTYEFSGSKDFVYCQHGIHEAVRYRWTGRKMVEVATQQHRLDRTPRRAHHPARC